MSLNHAKLKEFFIKSLSSSKRARVRKGLKLTEVKKIEKIDPVIEDIKDTCISQAKRTGYGLPPEYYVKHYKNWRSWIKREWWGVYYKKKLIAYRYDILINDTMYFIATKSHTDFLDNCPNDALMYTFISYCKSLKGCKWLNAGDWNVYKPTINNFKQLFGFEKVDLPIYTKYNPLINIFKKLNSVIVKNNE